MTKEGQTFKLNDSIEIILKPEGLRVNVRVLGTTGGECWVGQDTPINGVVQRLASAIKDRINDNLTFSERIRAQRKLIEEDD